MFKQYRDLYERMHQAQMDQALKAAEWERMRLIYETQAETITERNLQLEADNKKLAEALEAAQQHIQSNPGYIQNVMDLMERYQREVLQEIPLTPDQQHEWLTPGEDE